MTASLPSQCSGNNASLWEIQRKGEENWKKYEEKMPSSPVGGRKQEKKGKLEITGKKEYGERGG